MLKFSGSLLQRSNSKMAFPEFKCSYHCYEPFDCVTKCQVGNDPTNSLYIRPIPASFGAPHSGDQTFVVIMTALVQLMAPGFAFLYGGLAGAESIVSVMMLAFGTSGVITLLWVIIG